MELWEGALLAVGGLWLVGYMSRKNANHPINAGAAGVGTADGGTGTSAISNLTTIGTGAGSGAPNMVAGEPVAPPVMRMRPVANPILRTVTAAPGPFRPPVRPIQQHL